MHSINIQPFERLLITEFIELALYRRALRFTVLNACENMNGPVYNTTKGV